MGSSSVCAAVGYHVPEWVHHDSEAAPRGRSSERGLRSKALRREQPFHLYLPARFNRAMRYPLMSCTTAPTT